MTHAMVWHPLCASVCVDMLSGEADVRAGVAALCVRSMCGRDGGRRCPRSWVFFQRASPWYGSASVVVCTRVLSAELVRCLLKSA